MGMQGRQLVDMTLRYPNRLAIERSAAGIESLADMARLAAIEPDAYAALEDGAILPTPEEMDRIKVALGGIPRLRLYRRGEAQSIGVSRPDHEDRYTTDPKFAWDKAWNSWQASERLLVARDELTWIETVPSRPDRKIDVMVNMSCGTQSSPILLLDTVASLKALGVNFLATAGRAGCCAKPYWTSGLVDRGQRMHRAAIDRANAWGATTHVNWCTACQI